MVKLDVYLLRYLTKDDFRVLTAIEMGMRNHELVPTVLAYSISGIQNGSVSKILLNLTRHKLLSYERGKRYDGYRLTYRGYDYLALNALRNRGITFMGNQIGVGKESDVYVGSNDEGRKFAIKFHRLGRVCFRKVSDKRDYQKKNQNHKTASWIYLSRLAATREFTFMKLLYEQKLLPVPEPIDMNRHCIVMELIDGVILNQINTDVLKEEKMVGKLYDKLMAIMIKLTNEFGVVHGDFNEFNVLIKLDGSFDPILIDFPQMISINHELAKIYFNRDVNCIVDFFARRFHYESDTIPVFESLQENSTTKDLQNLADALEDENILNYSERKNIDSLHKLSDGKNALLSKFLDSLIQDEEVISNNNSNLYYSKKTDENLMAIEKLDESLNDLSLTKSALGTIQRGCDPIHSNLYLEEKSDERNLRNDETQGECDKISHYSDTYSTASTFSPREIRNRLKKENKKREIKQRMKMNPKSVKGEANVTRRKKKNNQKLANEDLIAIHGDGF